MYRKYLALYMTLKFSKIIASKAKRKNSKF